jgi:nucleoside-diphosphate-sugar epimerase
MKVLVLGGAGYSGSVLVQALIERGDTVTVLDTFWFGDWLENHPNLKKVKGDIRNPSSFPKGRFDALIHLANIANDPGVELSPVLSWEVNVLATKLISEWVVSNSISHVIYASSGSVYGIKEEENVTEDLSLVPITAYNKTKMIAERVLLSYKEYFRLSIIRPATICGISPRMRFDLTVNMLTAQALKNKKITVFGGNQIRPNIHIRDLARVYMHFLDKQDLPTAIYNAGFENLTVLQIAEAIKEQTQAEIVISTSNDPRSYRLNSSLLLSTGFSPKSNVKNAIKEVIGLVNSGFDVDRKEWKTVESLKSLRLTEKTDD